MQEIITGLGVTSLQYSVMDNTFLILNIYHFPIRFSPTD